MAHGQAAESATRPDVGRYRLPVGRHPDTQYRGECRALARARWLLVPRVMRPSHHPVTGARSNGDGPVYGARSPEDTALYSLVQAHLDAFLAHAAATCQRNLPRYLERAFRGYLDCGVFAHGFLRWHCDHCGRHLLVAFSCKSRGVCPSCNARRMCNTAAHITDRWIQLLLQRRGASVRDHRPPPAARISAACPSWSAPIVGTSPRRSPRARTASHASRNATTSVMTCTAPL